MVKLPLIVQWVVGLIPHGGPIEKCLRSSQCCPVYGIVHIKEPLLLIGKSNP